MMNIIQKILNKFRLSNLQEISEIDRRTLDEIRLLYHEDYIDAITDRVENFESRIDTQQKKLPKEYHHLIEEIPYYKNIDSILYVGKRIK